MTTERNPPWFLLTWWIFGLAVMGFVVWSESMADVPLWRRIAASALLGVACVLGILWTVRPLKSRSFLASLILAFASVLSVVCVWPLLRTPDRVHLTKSDGHDLELATDMDPELNSEVVTEIQPARELVEFQNEIEDIRRTAKSSVAKSQFQKAFADVEEFEKRWRPKEQLLDAKDELDKLVDEYAFLEELERLSTQATEDLSNTGPSAPSDVPSH